MVELAGEKEFTLDTSRILVDELAEILHRKKLSKQIAATGLTAGQMITNYRRLATLVTVRQLTQQVSRDADKMQCWPALAAHADLMVSGDKDLLVLKAFQGIPIVTAAQAIQNINAG